MQLACGGRLKAANAQVGYKGGGREASAFDRSGPSSPVLQHVAACAGFVQFRPFLLR